MTFRKVLFALGALFAGNALAQSSFSIYFNGESSTANCHVDGVSNAQLSTSGSGNLVATATTPLAFSSACGISGNAEQLTFGPAQPLKGPASSLAAGSNVSGSFSVLPLNAVSCTVAISTTSGTGTATGPASGYVCGSSGSQSCASSTPIAFNASFTNTGASASSYQATVTCQAASGASPATLASQATVNQSGNSGGTPSANFTYSASNLAVTFTDTSTDTGGTINAWSWNFGDSSTSTTQSPSHTYAAAGTYSVALTVTDSVSGAQSTKTQSVTVSTVGGNCPTIASTTTGISSFTQLTGLQNVFYFGGGNSSVDPTSFASVYFGLWPGSYNTTAVVTLPNNKYLSEVFTVPANYMTASNAPNPLYGRYTVGESNFSANVSMTISTACGDFSDPTTNPTSTVVSGCYSNKGAADSAITWSNTGTCVLQNSTTYYLNIINANIANIKPNGGGNASSTKNNNCSGGACTVPVGNGPGTWNGYTPH